MNITGRVHRSIRRDAGDEAADFFRVAGSCVFNDAFEDAWRQMELTHRSYDQKSNADGSRKGFVCISCPTVVAGP